MNKETQFVDPKIQEYLDSMAALKDICIKFWDPADQHITANSYGFDKENSLASYHKYRKMPGLIHFLYIFLFIWGFFDWLVLIPFLLKVAPITDATLYVILFLVILGPGPILWFRRYIVGLEKDIINYVIAEEFGWAYSGQKKVPRYITLATKYPLIFEFRVEQFKSRRDIANGISNSEYLEDEFWGQFEYLGKPVSFWIGHLKYQSGGGNTSLDQFGDQKLPDLWDAKSRVVFGFKLNRFVKETFCLTPKTFWGYLKNNPDLKTGFIKLDRSFHFDYNDELGLAEEVEILRNITPAVQVALIELFEYRGPFTVLFQEDVVFFSFKGELLKNKKTNFLKSLEISAIDKGMILKDLNNTFFIISEMLKHLN